MARHITVGDVSIVNQRFDEFGDGKPKFQTQEELLEYLESSVSRIGDVGELGIARYSHEHLTSTIIWLLPEEMGITIMAPLILDLLNGLWEIQEARDRIADATFRHGFDPITNEEDYGWSKANTWADFVQGQGGVRPDVDEVYDTQGKRSGTRISMLLSTGRNLLGKAIYGR